MLSYVYGNCKSVQCVKTWNGGCTDRLSFLLTEYGDHEYSVEECYHKCLGTQLCVAFSIKITDGLCDLYKTGCLKSGNKNKNYYSMDTCSRGKLG